MPARPKTASGGLRTVPRRHVGRNAPQPTEPSGKNRLRYDYAWRGAPMPKPKPKPNSPCSGASRAPSPQEYQREGGIAGDLSNSFDPYGMSGAAGAFLTTSNLYDFRRGGRLDAQVRYAGSTAYANYAFGVSASAAGLTLAQALSGANDYAGQRSSYAPGTQYDPNYPKVPAVNVKNINSGYNDQKNGTLCMKGG